MSGFSYPEWVGDFYPPKTKREQMLAYYSTRFPAVEINMTFRRRPLPATIERWRDAVGEDFRFTFKANAGITHYGTGSGPVYYGSGYVSQADWWRVGFAISVLNLLIWLGVGMWWWKLIGMW